MGDDEASLGRVIAALREREKELECIYRAKSLVRRRLPLQDFFDEFVRLIPEGWQYPEICRARIKFEGWRYTAAPWPDDAEPQRAYVYVDDQILGTIEVAYLAGRQGFPAAPEFLAEEQKLLNALADVVGGYVFDLRLEQSIQLLRQQSQARLTEGQKVLSARADAHWRWRERMAKAVAERLDFERFAVHAVYLIGSSKTGTAGPASDIDLIVHHAADAAGLAEMDAWLRGWSSCLAELNFERTGYSVPGILDVHFVTDADIAARSSYAVMIDSPVSSARALRVAADDD